MKVLLINPPTLNELVGMTPGDVENARGFTPPLGLLYIAGYLERHSTHEVEVMDTQPHGWDYAELAEHLKQRTFDVCGVTAMTWTLIDALKTCRTVRRLHPHVTIVLGGPHAHLYPEETLAHPEVDCLIQGEGEIAFVRLLDVLHDPNQWTQVPGLVFHDTEGRVVNNGLAPAIEDLDQLGFPARHKVNPAHYASVLGKGGRITTLFTSRGCPYRCTFCNRPDSPILSQFRWCSATHVADEIEMCLEDGITEALIYDDTFTVRKDRVHALCDEILHRGLSFRWDVRAHVNTLTPDLLKHMAEAGCPRIHLGVESGNDRMLRVIRKGTDIRRIKKAFKHTQEAGMETLAYFMIGQQTETLQDIQDSIALAKQLKPDYVNFSIFCPLPGTQVYQEGMARGIVQGDVWRHFSKNPTRTYKIPVWEEHFTRDELVKLLVQCYHSFYIRPGYVLHRLRKIQSFSQLAKHASTGLSVLRMKASPSFFNAGVQQKSTKHTPKD